LNNRKYGCRYNNNASTKKQKNLSKLSNQRNTFVKGIVNNPNGSPLNNNNFSNQNPRNPQ